MQKSNKSIAGYHLLMILSAVDDEFASEEGIKIQQYLAEEFPFRIDLDNEIDAIARLKRAEWKAHFEFHAKCFLEDSVEKERKDFLAFAKSLIKADEQVSSDEHQFYTHLKTLWSV